MSNQGQQFVVRSEIFETFRFLDQCQLSTEKKINICTAILNYTNDEGPSFQTQNVAKRLISSISKGFVVKKRPHLTYIYRTYMITFKQEEKRAESVQLPETALPKDQMWMANGESDCWSLVM